MCNWQQNTAYQHGTLKHGLNSTNTNDKSQSITWNQIYKEHQKVTEKYGYPKRIRCDRVWYERLSEFIRAQELEQSKYKLLQYDELDIDYLFTLTMLGTPIKIYEDMQENTWHFEDMFGDKYT